MSDNPLKELFIQKEKAREEFNACCVANTPEDMDARLELDIAKHRAFIKYQNATRIYESSLHGMFANENNHDPRS